jgi:hypothetical protein
MDANLKFITMADLSGAIENDQLDDLTQSTPAHLERAELSAIDEIKSYLLVPGIYDFGKIFAAQADRTPDNPRNQFLVTMCVDIALYHLHKSLVPRNIPEVRITAYENALKWLEKAKEGKTRLEGAILPPEEQTQGDFHFISVHPKQNWYF